MNCFCIYVRTSEVDWKYETTSTFIFLRIRMQIDPTWQSKDFHMSDATASGVFPTAYSRVCSRYQSSIIRPMLLNSPSLPYTCPNHPPHLQQCQ